VRYVGVTVTAADRRRAEHLRRAKAGGRTRRDKWIRALLASGVEPAVVVLDRVPADGLFDAEVRWIAKLRAGGHNLVNGTPGGEGRRGPMPPGARERMSAARRGKPKSPEHRAAIAAALTGRKAPERTPEWRAVLAAKMRGREHSSETRRKIAESNQRRLADRPDLRAKLGKYERDDVHRQTMAAALARAHAAKSARGEPWKRPS
jgi:hypothetical protein